MFDFDNLPLRWFAEKIRCWWNLSEGIYSVYSVQWCELWVGWWGGDGMQEFKEARWWSTTLVLSITFPCIYKSFIFLAFTLIIAPFLGGTVILTYICYAELRTLESQKTTRSVMITVCCMGRLRSPWIALFAYAYFMLQPFHEYSIFKELSWSETFRTVTETDVCQHLKRKINFLCSIQLANVKVLKT